MSTKKLKMTHARKMQVYFVTVLVVFKRISCFIPKFQRKFEDEKAVLRVLYRNNPWWLGILCLEVSFQYHNGIKFFSGAFFPKGAPKEQVTAVEGEAGGTMCSTLRMEGVGSQQCVRTSLKWSYEILFHQSEHLAETWGWPQSVPGTDLQQLLSELAPCKGA